MDGAIHRAAGKLLVEEINHISSSILRKNLSRCNAYILKLFFNRKINVIVFRANSTFQGITQSLFSSKHFDRQRNRMEFMTRVTYL